MCVQRRRRGHGRRNFREQRRTGRGMWTRAFSKRSWGNIRAVEFVVDFVTSVCVRVQEFVDFCDVGFVAKFILSSQHFVQKVGW